MHTSLRLLVSIWRASEASETLSGLFNRESRIYIIGRAKRAPHWGVQSRFRVIYIYLRASERSERSEHTVVLSSRFLYIIESERV